MHRDSHADLWGKKETKNTTTEIGIVPVISTFIDQITTH